LSKAGYERYEVSAYAKKNQECKHNLNYWRFGDYIGLVLAHMEKSLFRIALLARFVNGTQETYMSAMESKGNSLIESKVIETKDLPFEFMLNALRLTSGVETYTFSERTGLPLSVISKGLAEASKKGLLDENPNKLKATEMGLRYLNNLQELFLN
jgi:oxygen-independent coproporphyrinogen-3 oxidase